MRFADPYTIRVKKSHGSILFAASQLQGKRPRQEDYFINFNDECFVVADAGGTAHGDIAPRLACETGIWAYRHVSQRAYYWADKVKLLKRIFRTTNMRVWQKRRESGYADGLQTSMLTAIVNSKKIWVGNVGDSNAFLFRDGLIDPLMKTSSDPTNIIGVKRLGLVAETRSERFLSGDCLLLATDGVIDFLDEEEMRVALTESGDTNETITNALVHILKTAEENGSVDNMTACLIKSISNN